MNKTIAIDADAALLATLVDLLGVDSEREAAELGLNRIANIIEIELLNATTGVYWPGFDAAEYLQTGTSHMTGGGDEDPEDEDVEQGINP
jgi:hypothetical protein